MKKRLIYFTLTVIITVLGLASRKFSGFLPGIIAAYSGDILWSLMVYWIFRFISPKASPIKTAIAAIAFSYLIEISQLYHAQWIDNIRRTTIGALILGFGFLWSDIICYTIGVIIGITLDSLLGGFKHGTVRSN